MSRTDNRDNHEARPIKLTPGFMVQADGSVLIETGRTRVICTATLEEGVPKFLKGKGRGWASAEYGMLPASANSRMRRERNGPSGRTAEIQRLIGRSLRAGLDFEALGERTLWIDCDVIEADGGTRTAAITGGFVAMVLALQKAKTKGIEFKRFPVIHQIASISLGIVDSKILCDLDYPEDSAAEVDCNIVMTKSGQIIEIQGTAEGKPFAKDQVSSMLEMAEQGLLKHFVAQSAVTGPLD